MGVVRSTIMVGAFTLFSRLFGFARECLMTFCLGAGACSDAFLIALRIANTFRRIFAEGAFNASFLPRFSKILHQNEKIEANIVLSDVFCALLQVLVCFCAVVIIFFPPILTVLVSGFDVFSEKFGLTVVLGRICFSYLILISIASLFSGVLNTINKFALPALSFSLLSIFTAIGILIGHCLNLSNFITVHIMAICVVLSGFAQTYLLFRSVRKHGFKISLRFNCWTHHVKSIMKNMIPGIIGAGVWQLNILIDTCVSSYLPTGTITCVNIADRLNQFPLGTIGIALSTALLPSLSKFINTHEQKKAMAELEKGLLFALFFVFFAMAWLIPLSESSIAVAFQRGMFGGEQVKIAAEALVGFVIGLPA
ncbi:MAG: murein biosynthesis integral membrane protein MurJ, partial [Holosporaceae bacterium]|nr:murein biosynthesis integral membrane protein MurJ [Holosporaceae bacterium]